MINYTIYYIINGEIKQFSSSSSTIMINLAKNGFWVSNNFKEVYQDEPIEVIPCTFIPPSQVREVKRWVVS